MTDEEFFISYIKESAEDDGMILYKSNNRYFMAFTNIKILFEIKVAKFRGKSAIHPISDPPENLWKKYFND